MKQITSLFLALIMLCITPLTTIAYAQQLDEYGGVVVYIPLDMELLEKKFREYVKNAAAYYYDQADQGASFSYSKYYYEAADLKAAFDSEWGGLFESDRQNLAYNTQESASKRDYKQETREITLYMLSQDVQNKADQLKALSPSEKAAFYPGIMLDPITGELTVNKQAVIAQEQYYSDVQKQIDDGVADATMLFIDTAVDVGMGIGGVKNEHAYGITGALTDLISNIWKYNVQLAYEEEQKQLENLYRAAMIADITAAQQNVDKQMFDGLYKLHDELKKKGTVDTETKILIESLEQLLSAIEESRDIDSVLSKQVNGVTIDQEIDRIARELVDNAGMTEEELRTENELMLAAWEYGITEALLSVASYAASAIADNKIDGKYEDEYEAIAAVVTVAVKDVFADIKNGTLDLSDVNLMDNVDSVLKTIVAELADKVPISYLEQQVSKAKEAADAAGKKWSDSKSRYEATYKQNKKMSPSQSASSDLKKKERKLKKAEEWRKQNGSLFNALVDDSIKLIECTVDLMSSMASLDDMFDSEVTISYVASAMYRAKELAEEGRANVLLNYAHLANPASIDQADLDELKDFLDSMYVVLNTDMLGESYYATLAGWYEFQKDPEMDKKQREEVDAYFDAVCDNAWDSGAGGKAAVVVNQINPAWYATYWWMWIGVASDSEYLEKVQKESNLNSWLSTGSASSKYDSLAEIVSTAYEFPALYEPLFK